MRYILICLMTLSLVSCDPKDINKALEMISEAGGGTFNVADGLKEALSFGVDESVKKLSASNGYKNSIYKILLPEETANLVTKLRIVPGFEKFETTAITKINQAAEDAAKKAAPIFTRAITQMTFDDATRILMGADNEATNYLHRKTYNSLTAQFTPVIEQSLNKFGAVDYYADAVNYYNQKIAALFGLKKLNPSITQHVTSKALEGLFDLIQKKEKKIRTDVTQRKTELLRQVFAKQDN